MKMPKAWLTASSQNQPKKRGETRAYSTLDELGFAPHPAQQPPAPNRIDMSEEVAGSGMCPDCRKPMARSQVNSIHSFVCVPCRISIPVADSVVAAEGGHGLAATFGPSTAVAGQGQ